MADRIDFIVDVIRSRTTTLVRLKARAYLIERGWWCVTGARIFLKSKSTQTPPLITCLAMATKASWEVDPETRSKVSSHLAC